MPSSSRCFILEDKTSKVGLSWNRAGIPKFLTLASSCQRPQQYDDKSLLSHSLSLLSLSRTHTHGHAHLSMRAHINLHTLSERHVHSFCLQIILSLISRRVGGAAYLGTHIQSNFSASGCQCPQLLSFLRANSASFH